LRQWQKAGAIRPFVFHGAFSCEPSHAQAVNSLAASAQAFSYLAIVNREGRQRGVPCDSAREQRDLRLGAEQVSKH